MNCTVLHPIYPTHSAYWFCAPRSNTLFLASSCFYLFSCLLMAPPSFGFPTTFPSCPWLSKSFPWSYTLPFSSWGKLPYSLKIIFKIYLLILQRDRKRERERKKHYFKREKHINVREKHQQIASHMSPDCRLNPQPRYVIWLEIKLPTIAVWNDTPPNWATLFRAPAIC